MPLVAYPTPKAKFQAEAAYVREHKALIQTPAFERAIDTALLQFSNQLSKTPPSDMGGAASSYLRLLGAQEFAHLLFNLAEQPIATPKRDLDNLDHRS